MYIDVRLIDAISRGLHFIFFDKREDEIRDEKEYSES